MAGTKSIDHARERLEEALLDTTQIVEAFAELAGESQPPWLWTLWRRVRQIDELAHGYMAAVHEHARPLLTDMEALARVK